jgi:hypothetical protein
MKIEQQKELLEKLREALDKSGMHASADAWEIIRLLSSGYAGPREAAVLGYRSRDGIVYILNEALRASMDRENAKQLEIDQLTQEKAELVEVLTAIMSNNGTRGLYDTATLYDAHIQADALLAKYSAKGDQ